MFSIAATAPKLCYKPNETAGRLMPLFPVRLNFIES